MNFIKLYQQIFPNMPKDPVKHCHVHKTVGCAHVDGMHCNMDTCNIEVEAKVTPDGIYTKKEN